MKDCLSVKEYATLHGMTEQAVYKKIRAGKLRDGTFYTDCVLTADRLPAE